MKETTENTLQSQNEKSEREYTDERKYCSGITDKIKYPRELAFTSDQILNTDKFLPAYLECKEEGRIETLTNNLKSLIAKNYTFEESCELLDTEIFKMA